MRCLAPTAPPSPSPVVSHADRGPSNMNRPWSDGDRCLDRAARVDQSHDSYGPRRRVSETLHSDPGTMQRHASERPRRPL